MNRASGMLLVWFAGGIFAQPATPPHAFEAFEVATIKPTPPDWGKGRYIRMLSAHQLEAKNHALKTLLAAAYNLNPKAIFGVPEWNDADHYDILAKTPGDTRPDLDAQMAMLRKLLTDRFQLSFHREQREMPIYSLTVAKGGPKLRESAPNETPEGPPALAFVIYSDGVRLPAFSATMSELASVMQRAALDRPVIDQTEITGRYDFDLEWLPDENQFGGLGLRPNPNQPKPDLFAAVQLQLGLKLEARRGRVDVLVVDRAEKPSEN